MGILAELSANVDPVEGLMYVACRRSGCIVIAVHRHWEGVIEMSKLSVGTEPVGLTLLVGFTLGTKFKKAWLCSASLVSASGPPPAGRCSCAVKCNDAHAVLLTSLWLQFPERKCFAVGCFDMGR